MSFEVQESKRIRGRCVVMVSSLGGFHRDQCSHKGVVELNGKLYCKQHNPERVAKKDRERRAKRDREGAVRHEKWRRQNRYPEAIRLLREAVKCGDPQGEVEDEIEKFLSEEPKP